MGIKSLYREYRRTLKGVELEEYLDLVLFRPIAYLYVRAIKDSRITPNQVTLFSLVLGLAAGWCYWHGTTVWLIAGSVCLFFNNVLDCADGMLARLRGGGSLIGYIVDGVADYLTDIALMVGLLHGLATVTGRPGFVWGIGVPAGISWAWWCAMVDRIRNEWLEKVYDRRRDPAAELAELEALVRRWRREGSHYGQRVLVYLYAAYVRLWYSGPIHDRNGAAFGVPTAAWIERRKPVLRMAVLMGPTMQRSLIMVAGWLGHMEYFVWTVLVFGTVWGLIVMLARAAADNRLATMALKGVRD